FDPYLERYKGWLKDLENGTWGGSFLADFERLEREVKAKFNPSGTETLAEFPNSPRKPPPGSAPPPAPPAGLTPDKVEVPTVKNRDDLAVKLESLRGLNFKSPLVLREGTRREYAAYVLENAKRVYGTDLTSAEKGLKALGLIPPKLRLDVALTAQAGLGAKVFCAGGEVILLDPKAGDEWILNKMDLGLVDQHFVPPAAATF